ncbi:uncharacterized protein [Rutidosis leptorrhynchoides]|uniref:uncharacterized protein n=1 Tax=Rutidosis leptorrhynchoides TaxID=125765 RepID=UPI003A9958C5
MFDRDDCWEYTLESDGLFSVKSAREYIDRKLLPSSTVETLWFKFVPRKINIFLWRLRLDSLPLRWNLSARGIDANSIVCPICSNGREIRDHLFFDCSVSTALWAKVCIWLNCNMPSFQSWDYFISWIDGSRLSHINKDRIKAVVITLFWVLWRFRNGIVFNDTFCNRCNLFDFVMSLSFTWIKNRGHLVSNWNSWLSMPF